MSRLATLLEGLCAHALSLGAQSIEVEHKDDRECVIAKIGSERTRIANYASSSADGKEVRQNLSAAAKKPIRTAIGGRVYLLTASAFADPSRVAFTVTIDLAPPLDPSSPPAFTAKQGQYLAFIYNCTKIHGQAPAESDLERYFRVSPPAIHDMLRTLELKGLIERTPGRPRSIRLRVPPENLPRLE